ncbi:hypothetical protein Rsub_08195 [Raphidocelis subcapitata]|uniref:NAD(P)-binding domain-containing protein n=1 Tax=Raphidocelis subcapitata TaxID=307507 RepID=A0A2V0P875_9CHLO|nr:hypothetical protein Rsub_08195 [Raphidocelis subcapitata]|eukprot:GBF95759.1 hypothetical protein Rsub_08195 [Raphidocelis subcapitata]
MKRLIAGGADEYAPVPIVRSDKSAKKVEGDNGLPAGSARVLDIAANDLAAATAALQGCDALVIATSAVPQIVFLSLIPVMIKKLLRSDNPGRPSFTWKEGQNPEKVDWLGQKLQIDAAKAAGVKQVVLVGSMGGTDPSNMLNKLVGEDGGNILQWKRRAEQYLTASGLEYTIIHPGGLIDEEGGKRRLALGVDDSLLKRTTRNIPRADVAALAVGCIGLAAAKNRAFDVCADPLGEGEPSSDWAEVLAQLGGANCDYSINSQAGAPVAAAAQ